MPKAEEASAELRLLNALCLKFFDMPATLIKYKLDELDRRIELIEKSMEGALPIIGAAALKVEAVTSCLHQSSVVSIEQINKQVEVIGSSMTKNTNRNLLLTS